MRVRRSESGPRRSSTRERGFTLIELLLVIVIIATLAAIVVPQLAGRGEDARVGAAKAQIAAFESALDQFEVDNGSYPTTEHGLGALWQNPDASRFTKWKGYLKKDVPVDPWGMPYVYKAPGIHHPKTYDIVCGGPDRREGTDDDVSNWNLDKK